MEEFFDRRIESFLRALGWTEKVICYTGYGSSESIRVLGRVVLVPARARGGLGKATEVLSQVAVGPHQRVVTVQVQHEGAQAVLVLGVTAQQVQCLHVLQAAPADAAFSHALAQAQGSALDTTAER